MSKVESGFVPLSKVEQEQPLYNVNIHLGLPGFLDQDRLGVNLTRIDRLRTLSGIRELLVVGVSEAQRSRGELNVAGIYSDGSAVASKTTAIAKVESYKVESNDDRFFTSSARTVDVKISIDLDQLSQQARDSKARVYSPEPWAKGIDKSLRGGIREKGSRNLLTLAPHDLAILTVVSVTSSFGLLGPLWGINPPEAALVEVGLFWLTLKAIDFHHRATTPNLRSSIFPSFLPQLDRAAAVQVLARTQKLVADLHPDKK